MGADASMLPIQALSSWKHTDSINWSSWVVLKLSGQRSGIFA